MTNLWESIKKGDKKAFIELYETFYQDLYAYGFKISGDKELVKDCIQQVYLEIWDNRENQSEVNFLKSYLLKYFKRKLFREMAQRSKESSSYDNPIGMELSYEELLIKNQSSEDLQFKLHEALDKLTNKQKQVIKMKFFEGLTYDEIAEITSSKNRTVYNQVYEALKILKQYISTLAIFYLFFAK
ncbi:sigma-70 family RNA polymerase sigma factor [Reichenbachiella sp. MALMAid0571]|uniref:RNA polymerase sigma factor n=1 Tax=Reichenbachiella sp. MALMAid0571 TaxID=3143939 RepID=UPI0032DF175E